MAKKQLKELEVTPMIEELDTPANAQELTDVPPDTVSSPLDGENLDDLLAAMDGEETPPQEAPGTLEQNDSVSGDESPSGESADEPKPPAGDPEAPDRPEPKPKRASRKKKAAESPPESNSLKAENGQPVSAPPAQPESIPCATPPKRTERKKPAPILTIDARAEAETQENIEDTIWHEIHNAYRTRKILTGNLGGIEQTENGKTLAIVEYKGFRIIIPLKEMMINLGQSASGTEYEDLMRRQNKILGNMLGAEIDFMVKGIDSKTRSAVASRKEAMLKKRQLFYLHTDAAGMYRIYEGRVVQGRVIAVAEKVIRVEVFGAECSIMARDLSWDWIGDAHERFSVGDQILVRILSVKRGGLEDISIKADVKSVSENTNHENLKKCRVQSKYAGKVTDVHKGVVYVRLTNGINAVAHSCYDRRMPGKKDDVSFAVTRIDEERGVAVGIITRIIKQNL